MDVIRIVEPERFDEFYSLVRDSYLIKDKSSQNDFIVKNVLSLREWSANNLSKMLNSASDDAVNGYTRYRAKFFNDILAMDPSGIECFNSIHPGVLGNPDLDRIGKQLGENSAGQRKYMEAITHSIQQHVEVNRLPVEKVKEALTNTLVKLVERHEDLLNSVDVEDINELAKHPKLACEFERDLYVLISALDPHTSAEVTRYLTEHK
ncbi:protein of unknown function [Xenorhabdus poinarii G6]|uniref:Uncharacterized protein n=1 Tax=Xenorhabdus poinarii G6 TaxID=1354304 RepID=A0A068R3Q3_9GAMM|nr:hypothetical protein [Xenorhabdus poinarii]CDG21664.1 protein of unknown function [Xenorhabdus poinarii G6]